MTTPRARTAFAILVALLLATPLCTAFAADALPTDMPVVYVAPQQSFAGVGTTFNVSIRIFNLTNRFYSTGTVWSPEEDLGPYSEFGPYNYSMGNLYGFTLQLRWDPTVLQYVQHLAHTPVELYPDGILYGPVIKIQDDIDSTAGTYTLVQYSAPYLQGFNCVNRSVTVCTLSFRVIADAAAAVQLERVELIPDPALPGVRDVIPVRTMDSHFTPVAVSHITVLRVGAQVGTQLYDPVIVGENATVQIRVANHGEAASVYNLTLYEGARPLTTWTNETLSTGGTANFTYTLVAAELDVGTHTLTAQARISYKATVMLDTATANVTLIHPPTLIITRSATDVHVNDAVTLSASASVHPDSNSRLTSYVWILYKPSSVLPVSHGGVTILQNFTEAGIWRIILLAEDNWKVTYTSDRAATAPYRTELLLDVSAGNHSSPDDVWSLEQVALIASLVGLSAVGLIVYVISRQRKNP